MSSNMIGRVLPDQFRVGAFIASGGMGAICHRLTGSNYCDYQPCWDQRKWK